MRPPQAQPAPRSFAPAPRRACLAMVFAVGVAALLAGCGAGPPPAADDLDEALLMSTVKDLDEVPLGRFSVSIPGVRPHPMGGPEARNLVQFDFQLSMETPPAKFGSATRTAERQRGEVRNRVIGVCRSTDLEDLSEHDLVTFKSHMLDTLEPVFGRDVISRLIVTDIMTNPL